MIIRPVCALDDNYVWVMVQENTAIVIDPGEALPVLDFLKTHQLDLSAIWITHHHSDHIGGVGELLQAYPKARLYANKEHNVGQFAPIFVDELGCGGDEVLGEVFAFGHQASIWRTFGHTNSHLSYVLNVHNQIHVFCGDTLFRAGCGRVFTGTIEQLYDSFVRYNTLPDETLFYPAHEYTLGNLDFASGVEPSNWHITQAATEDKNKRNNDLPTLPATLAKERKINPFLRAVIAPTDEMMAYVKDNLGQVPNDKTKLFACLRELKNRA